MFRRSEQSHAGFPAISLGAHYLLLVQVNYLCEFLDPGLDPFSYHSSLSATRLQEFGSVFSYRCLPLFPSATYEGFMMAYKLVINLILKEGYI